MFKIGCNCNEMCISAFLIENNLGMLIVKYTNNDFIYNKEAFLQNESTLRGNELISPDNDLVILHNMKNHLNMLFWDLKEIHAARYGDVFISTKKISKKDFEDKQFYLARCDLHFLYEEYVKKNNKLVRFHTNQHKLLFRKVDEDFVEIIDGFYEYRGIVPQKTFKQSLVKCPEEDEIVYEKVVVDYHNIDVNQLYKSITILNPDDPCTIDIGGTIVYKNLLAIEHLLNDIDCIVESMFVVHNEVGIILFSRTLQQLILQKQSYFNYIKLFNLLPTENIILLENCKKMWNSIDPMCDVMYLKKYSSRMVVERLRALFQKILEAEKALSCLSCID